MFYQLSLYLITNFSWTKTYIWCRHLPVLILPDYCDNFESSNWTFIYQKLPLGHGLSGQITGWSWLRFCHKLPGLMENWQNWQSKGARWWEHHSQPTPIIQSGGPPCIMLLQLHTLIREWKSWHCHLPPAFISTPAPVSSSMAVMPSTSLLSLGPMTEAGCWNMAICVTKSAFLISFATEDWFMYQRLANRRDK